MSGLPRQSWAGLGPWRRLTVRWAFAVFVVSGIALVGQGVLLAWLTWKEERRLIAEVQLARVKGATDQIRSFSQTIEDRLGWLLATPWLARSDEERRIDALRLMREVSALAEIALIEPDGREAFALSRTRADRAGEGEDRSATFEIEEARKAGVFRSKVFFLDGSEPRMRVAVAGKPSQSSVAVGEIDLKHVWNIVSQIQIGRSGRVFVADADGRLIAHPDISLVLRSTSVAHLSSVTAALAGGDASSAALVEPVADVTGEPVLAAFARIPESGWVIVSELPVREAYEPVIAGLRWTVAIVVGALVVAVLASLLLARGMALPIQRLSLGAGRIGAGDLDHRIAVTSDDELGALGSRFNDMAERLQASHATLEARVQERTEQLRQADAAKTRFFAAASHDLRQPLHAFGLFLGQLANETDPDRRTATLCRLETSLAVMNDLFDALLDISQLDAGAVQPRVDDVPVQGILHALEATLGPIAEAKGLAFVVEPQDLVIRSDAMLLGRILQNLAANAIKYTPRGAIRITCIAVANSAIFSVSDTGIGIAPEHQALVFNEFYRIDNADVAGHSGLGLGLSIVARTARLLDHVIELDSMPGSGTTVRLVVPLGRVASALILPPPEPTASPVHSFGTGLRALVVDDAPIALDATVALLEDWGFEVEAAATADEARSGATARFDLIICDVHLGEDDGIALVLELTSGGGASAAILVSGALSPASAQAAPAARPPILHKPVSPMTLRATIIAALARTATNPPPASAGQEA